MTLKKKIILAVVAIPLAFLVFVTVRRLNATLYDLPDPAFLADMGAVNTLNDDNKIFKTGNLFIYRLRITDSVGHDQQLYLRNSLSGPEPALAPVNKEHDNPPYAIDHVTLEVFRNKGETGLGETQTIIKYDYKNGDRKVLFGEKTGVVEDSTRVFLHPPRSHFFYMNELTPFPYVRFPIAENTSWEMPFGIPDHAMKQYDYLTDTMLQLSYSLIERETIPTPWGIDSVYKFKAFAKNSEINTSCEYYFSERYGFVRIEFHNLHGVTIRMDLDDIKQVSQ
ncbi:MAG TPA: hypothetical protein VGD40_21155 [Chryseosolibacter sp.]